MKPGIRNQEYKTRNIKSGISNRAVKPGIEHQEYKANL